MSDINVHCCHVHFLSPAAVGNIAKLVISSRITWKSVSTEFLTVKCSLKKCLCLENSWLPSRINGNM